MSWLHHWYHLIDKIRNFLSHPNFLMFVYHLFRIPGNQYFRATHLQHCENWLGNKWKIASFAHTVDCLGVQCSKAISPFLRQMPSWEKSARARKNNLLLHTCLLRVHHIRVGEWCIPEIRNLQILSNVFLWIEVSFLCVRRIRVHLFSGWNL
jgi:hypothetical protein